MDSKIDSESDEEFFGSFMKVNKPQLNFSDSALSTMGESASKLLSECEENIDETPIVQGLKTTKAKTVRRNNKKPTRRQIPGKKTTRNRKLRAEENITAEDTEDAGNLAEPETKTKNKKKKGPLKRKATETLLISDEDSCSSTHSYRLRPKFTKANEEEIVTVSSSPAETTSAVGDEEGIACLPILETIKEELDQWINQTDQCDCCKVEKKNCANLTKGEDRKSLLDDLKALQESNQNTEKYILQQHRNLLKHPEMDSLCNSIDDSKSNNFLTKEKREWIEKFMDSMLADRIDYVQPNQVNSVLGLQHSSVETDTPVSETDHITSDSVTIVKRIDFEKEKKARLSQLLERQRSYLIKEPATPSCTADMNELATPSFSTRNMGATSTPITVNMLSSKNKKSEENDVDLSKLDFSFVTMRTPMKSNANEERGESSEMVLENANREEVPVVLVNESQEDLQTPADISGLPDSNSKTLPSSYIPRHLRPPTEPMDEEQIMSFVDDLLGADTEAIAQLVDNSFDRLVKYNETRTASRQNVINLIDDIYTSAIEDSVILIDDNVNGEDNNSIEILDDSSPIVINDSQDMPSTSHRPKRTARKKVISIRRRISPATVETVPSATPEKPSKGKRECPICLESMDSKEVSSTTCGHVFCTPCIKQAIKQTKRCPNCRKGLNLRKIHPLYL